MVRKLILLACGLSMAILLLAGASLPTSAFAATHRTSAVAPLLDACSSNPSNATCNGVLPEQTNCPADAQVLATTDIYSGTTVVGRIVLRYSPSCQTAWAHTVSNFNANLYAQIRRSDGLLYSRSAFGTGVRSPMVFVNFMAVRACGTINGAAACAPNS